MKKTAVMLAVAMTAALLGGCKPSRIEGERASLAETTKEETIAFVKPVETVKVPDEVRNSEGAGPGWTQADPEIEYAGYPEDKKPVYDEESENKTMVTIYYIDGGLIDQTFELVDEVNADSLIEKLIFNAVLKDTVKLVSFESENKEAVLELTGLESGYYKAKEETVLQAIANTFTENLEIDKMTIKAGPETYGPLEFKENK